MINRSKKFSPPVKNGFTLTEILVTTALFAVLAGTLYYLFGGLMRLRPYEEAQVATVRQCRTAMGELEKYISQSNRVLASRAFGGMTYSSGGTAVVLQLPSINSNGDIVEGAWDYAVFYFSGGSLRRLYEANASSVRHSGGNLLGDSISSVNFTYDNGNFAQVRSVGIDIVAQYTVRQQIVSHRSAGQISLKNY